MASVKFEDYSIKVKNALDDKVYDFLVGASNEIVTQTVRNIDTAANDSGQLKGSFSAHVDEAKGEAVVGSPLENALWTEFGTGEHALKHNGRAGAWYVPVEKVTGKKKPTYNGQVIIVYGTNGQKFYKTNGKKPVRMLQKAFDSKKAVIKKRAEQLFGELNNE